MEKLQKILEKLIIWLTPLAFSILTIQYGTSTIGAFEIIVISFTAIYYIAMIIDLIIKIIKGRK